MAICRCKSLRHVGWSLRYNYYTLIKQSGTYPQFIEGQEATVDFSYLFLLQEQSQLVLEKVLVELDCFCPQERPEIFTQELQTGSKPSSLHESAVSCGGLTAASLNDTAVSTGGVYDANRQGPAVCNNEQDDANVQRSCSSGSDQTVTHMRGHAVSSHEQVDANLQDSATSGNDQSLTNLQGHSASSNQQVNANLLDSATSGNDQSLSLIHI